MVNDLGGSHTGEGADKTPADEVVDIIKSRGGEAVSNYDDVSQWGGAENLVNSAIDAYGALDIVVNNAGILRDASIVKMTEQEFDSVHRACTSRARSTRRTSPAATGRTSRRKDASAAPPSSTR